MKPRFIFDEIKKYWDSPEAIVVTGMSRTTSKVAMAVDPAGE